MALDLPTSLTPSKVAAFKDCALAFRYSVIDRLPEPPSPAAVRGTLVHRALQRLHEAPAEQRTPATAAEVLAAVRAEAPDDPEVAALALTPEAEERMFADAARLVARSFELEDPRTVRSVGLELLLEAQVGGLTLRGIIDRLEEDDDGGLVVTDYKTGRVPGPLQEQQRLGGVHFYAFLCEQVLGRRPSRVQLLYLQEPVAIVARPSEQSLRGLERRVGAIWAAVERACAEEDFRPRPSRACDWCGFRAYCPARGGDPSLAAAAAPAPPPLAAV
jgi:putative RecB family exonuclease